MIRIRIKVLKKNQWVFDMISRDTLSEGETHLLRTVRLFNKDRDNNSLVGESGKVSEGLHGVIGKLIWLVQECDPFVVNLNNLNDHTVSVFELQVLYVISSFRAGREKDTIEILNWWLPSVKMQKALCLIRTITHILDEIEIETPPPDRLTAQILAITQTRLRKQRFRVIEGGLSAHYSETLH